MKLKLKQKRKLNVKVSILIYLEVKNEAALNEIKRSTLNDRFNPNLSGSKK